MNTYKLSTETREKMRIAKLGKKLSIETRKKMSDASKGKPKWWSVGVPKGYVHSEETRKKMSESRKGKKPWNFGRKWVERMGSNHHKWIEDRSLLKTYGDSEERRSPKYKDWRKQVWLRDNFKCKIANPDCCGRIEAHHILVWRDYPELRYEVNNGITLCHAHHPKKRAEEKRLVSTFQELVSMSVSKASN